MFHNIKLTVATIAVGFLKRVSKAHDILHAIHDNCKQVVSLIYTKQCVVSILHATKLCCVNWPQD